MSTHIFALIGCGDNCWEAKDDLCRCACGGRNHGIRKKQPHCHQIKRSCIAFESVYELLEVEQPANAENELLPTANELCRPILLDNKARTLNKDAGIFYYPRAATDKKPVGYLPHAILRPLTESQTTKWAEARAWRDINPLSYAIYSKPRALWVYNADLTNTCKAA